ncbi:two pore domain potassium channel family protein [Billgrantia azerbaijanica]|nr:two pore domain potassium channel family protein [Halomonas azerbaijanica]
MFDVPLDAGHLWAVGTTLITVVACILLHYEASIRLWRQKRLSHRSLRRRFLVLIFGLFAAHVAEIWLFAAATALLLEHPLAGGLGGISVANFFDYVYFSAITYTTLGYGDLVPQGPVRFLMGTEALTGFMLITWSASLTFLEMQRHWSSE